MKKLLPLILLLSACAETPNYRSNANDEKIKSEDDYNWVDQLNFDKKTETKYVADKDEFSLSNEEATHALVKESLVGIAPARLDETLSSSADALTKLNIKCYQGKFEEAFKMADELYSQFKNNNSYWNQLGSCYYLKDDYAKAILFYNKSRDLDAKFVPPINNIGVVYMKQGKYQKALAAFKKATDMSTFSVTPNFNLAELYLRFGTVSKAIPIFQGMIKRSPQDLQVLAALASAYLLKNDYSSALMIYEQMDKAALTRPGIGLNYAVTLKMLNKSNEAQAAFNNVSASANIDLKNYSQKVDKFIRN